MSKPVLQPSWDIREELDAALDDAFQFSGRPGWVSRPWAEGLIEKAVELGRRLAEEARGIDE